LKSEPLSLIELDGFWWKRDWAELERTVFNLTPCFNDFEKHFAKFLDTAPDITRFAKLAETYTKFSIEYLNHKGAISFYYPDFVAEQDLGKGSSKMWLIETKGWELVDVPLKDARAKDWCKDATKLTGLNWEYLKVKQLIYNGLTNDLIAMPGKSFEEFLKKLFQQKELL